MRKLAAKLGAYKSLEDGVGISKKAEYVRDMQTAQVELVKLRSERKKTTRKVTIESLAEDQRPKQLLPLNKQLADSVKMIAYRAEAALVAILRRYLKNEDETQALVGISSGMAASHALTP